MRRWFFLVSVLLSAAACRPQVGDKCLASSECSPDGREQRLCDTTSPDGYCTIPGCSADTCPEEATCASFQDDNFRFCMFACATNDECRTDAGYECILASALPPGTALIDSSLPTGYCGIAP